MIPVWNNPSPAELRETLAESFLDGFTSIGTPIREVHIMNSQESFLRTKQSIDACWGALGNAIRKATEETRPKE